jgi:hypothetical protein
MIVKVLIFFVLAFSLAANVIMAERLTRPLSPKEAADAYFETYRTLKRHCEDTERGEFSVRAEDGRPACTVESR